MPRSAHLAASAAPADPAPTTTRPHPLLAGRIGRQRRLAGKAGTPEPLRSAISDDTALKVGKVRAAYPGVGADSLQYKCASEAGAVRVEIAGPRDVDEKLNGVVCHVTYECHHLISRGQKYTYTARCVTRGKR